MNVLGRELDDGARPRDKLQVLEGCCFRLRITWLINFGPSWGPPTSGRGENP
jgi:hypothetical protein